MSRPRTPFSPSPFFAAPSTTRAGRLQGAPRGRSPTRSPLLERQQARPVLFGDKPRKSAFGKENLATRARDDVQGLFDSYERDHPDPYDAESSRRVKDDDDDDGDDGDDTFDWDEETTLVHIQDHTHSPLSAHAKLLARADEIGPTLGALGPALVADTVHAVFPAVRRVRAVHAALGGAVDPVFVRGLLEFDERCKAEEREALRGEEEVRVRLDEGKVNVERLLGRLRDQYAARDALWGDYRRMVSDIAERTKARLSEIPDEIAERTAYWEKKSKEAEKDGAASAKAKEKMLQTLLAQMG